MARQVARWELASIVDAFDVAMEVERTDLGLRLTARRVVAEPISR